MEDAKRAELQIIAHELDMVAGKLNDAFIKPLLFGQEPNKTLARRSKLESIHLTLTNAAGDIRRLEREARNEVDHRKD